MNFLGGVFYILEFLFIHVTNLKIVDYTVYACKWYSQFPFLNGTCKCLCLQWPLHKYFLKLYFASFSFPCLLSF